MIEQVQQLTTRIAALTARKQQIRSAALFRTRAESLSEPAQKLTNLAAIIALFRGQGIQVNLPEEKIASLKTHVTELRTAYEQDPSSIVQSDGERRFTFWEPIRKLPQEIEQVLQRAWTEFVQAQLPAPQPELLQVLGRIPAFQSVVREIETRLRQADDLKRRLPEQAQTFTQAMEVGEHLRAAWRRLPSDGLPDEIMNFLGAATVGRATLSDITPAVWQWLEQQNLLKSFKVTL